MFLKWTASKSHGRVADQNIKLSLKLVDRLMIVFADLMFPD